MILKFYELKYSGGAVSYQKSSGLDIPSKWNQEGVEGHGQTILCCRGAGIGSFPPLTGYALLQTQAVRSTPVSICLLLFIDSTGKKKNNLPKLLQMQTRTLSVTAMRGGVLVPSVEAWLMWPHWSSCHWCFLAQVNTQCNLTAG